MKSLLAALLVLPALAAAPAPRTAALNEVVEWSSSKDGEGVLYDVGPYELSLRSAQEVGTAESGVSWMPRMMVGQGDLNLSGVLGFAGHAEAKFTVARLDPAAAQPSIVLTSYSGGAHCCTDVQIATRSDIGWTVAHLGQFDSEPLGRPPADLDGDGAAELQIPDSRFAYAFDSYAGSFMPIRIFGVRSGKAVDLSGAPAMRPIYEAEIKRTEPLCRAHGSGSCAAYLADAARLGRVSEALPVVAAAMDETFTAFPNVRCGDEVTYGKCADGRPGRAVDYLTSLQLFLRQNGYPVAPPP